MHNTPHATLQKLQETFSLCRPHAYFASPAPLHVKWPSLLPVLIFSFTDLSELCTQEKKVSTPAALFDSKQSGLCLLLPSVVFVSMVLRGSVVFLFVLCSSRCNGSLWYHRLFLLIKTVKLKNIPVRLACENACAAHLNTVKYLQEKIAHSCNQ